MVADAVMKNQKKEPQKDQGSALVGVYSGQRFSRSMWQE